jgi:hypothetical protein
MGRRWIQRGSVCDFVLSDNRHGDRPLGFFRFPEAGVLGLEGAALVYRRLFFPDSFPSPLSRGPKKEAKNFLSRVIPAAGTSSPNQMLLLRRGICRQPEVMPSLRTERENLKSSPDQFIFLPGANNLTPKITLPQFPSSFSSSEFCSFSWNHME